MDVTRSPHRLEPVSATFHGRDVFAPVAAQLAAGRDLADAGEPLDPETLAAVELPEPLVEEDGTVVAHALTTDRFGNVVLERGHDASRRARASRSAPRSRSRRGGEPLPGHLHATFADVRARRG